MELCHKCNVKRYEKTRLNATTIQLKREIIERLLMTWHKVPEYRLSQLIWNTFQGWDFFYCCDDDFIKYIEESIKDN